MPYASYGTVTISNGGTVSTEFEVAQNQNVSIWMPSAWSPATLTIQAQREGSTDWHTVSDTDGVITIQADAGRVILLPASTMLPNGARRLRLVSSAAQGAQRVIGVERRGF